MLFFASVLISLFRAFWVMLVIVIFVLVYGLNHYWHQLYLATVFLSPVLNVDKVICVNKKDCIWPTTNLAGPGSLNFAAGERGRSGTHTMRKLEVMVRNPAGVGGSGIKKSPAQNCTLQQPYFKI